MVIVLKKPNNSSKPIGIQKKCVNVCNKSTKDWLGN